MCVFVCVTWNWYSHHGYVYEKENGQRPFNVTPFVLFFQRVIRYRTGLVGSRPLVAGEELLVVAYQIDVGPMLSSG